MRSAPDAGRVSTASGRKTPKFKSQEPNHKKQISFKFQIRSPSFKSEKYNDKNQITKTNKFQISNPKPEALNPKLLNQEPKTKNQKL